MSSSMAPQEWGKVISLRLWDIRLVVWILSPLHQGRQTLRFLLADRADHSWDKRIKKYLVPDLLIIDDFALSVLTPTQAEDFYEIVAERHLKSSIIITSNRPPQIGSLCS